MNIIKKSVFCILAIFAIVSAYLYVTSGNAQQNSTQGLSYTSDNNAINTYLNDLKNEEQAIWNEFQQINISPELCITLQEKYADEYENKCQNFIKTALCEEPLSDTIKTVTYETLKDFNMSSKDVQIISSQLNFPAIIAGDSYICINEKIMSLFPKNMQKFIIGHELQHIIHRDDSVRFVIKKFLNQVEFPIDHPLVKLAKYQEKRADILAACKDQSYAQAEINFMNYLQKIEEPHEDVGTYPTAQERLVFGKEILERINQTTVV